MKIPFSDFLGPYLRKYDWEIQGICAPCLFGSTLYVTTLSLVALILTMMDLMYLVRRDTITPCFLRSLNPKICPSLTKNLKIFSSGVNFVLYLMMGLGGFFEQGVMMMPYLTLQLINITLFFVLLIMACISRFNLLRKMALLVFVFMIHNWVHVFCCFRNLIRYHDF
ncbi:hypothetical protein O3M35_002050 [Rhynocoris fuscipes]|uniref:Uncharacterized protein n=1 Tax=Rhynocoris fuscipes TaxID=488301 RepID=A0AAW1CW85_9HEMI